MFKAEAVGLAVVPLGLFGEKFSLQAAQHLVALIAQNLQPAVTDIDHPPLEAAGVQHGRGAQIQFPLAVLGLGQQPHLSPKLVQFVFIVKILRGGFAHALTCLGPAKLLARTPRITALGFGHLAFLLECFIILA